MRSVHRVRQHVADLHGGNLEAQGRPHLLENLHVVHQASDSRRDSANDVRYRLLPSSEGARADREGETAEGNVVLGGEGQGVPAGQHQPPGAGQRVVVQSARRRGRPRVR